MLDRERIRTLADCKQVWVVSLANDGVSIRDLWPLLQTHLPFIEGEHPGSFWAQPMAPSNSPWFPNGLTDATNGALYRTGISFIRTVTVAPASAGRVLLLGTSVGGAIGPAKVTDVVNKELSKPDNQQKLIMSDRRSELFVWLDGTDAQLTMTSPLTSPYPIGQPADGPTLPPGATSVWAALLPDENRGALAIWHSIRGGIWQIETIDDPQFASRVLVRD